MSLKLIKAGEVGKAAEPVYTEEQQVSRELLQDLLKGVEEGRVQYIVIAAQNTDGTFCMGWACDEVLVRLGLAAALLGAATEASKRNE